MSDKIFTYVDPETGHETRAPFGDEAAYNALCAERDNALRRVHDFRFTLEVTQLGFDRQRSIVVAECAICEMTIAFPVVTFYVDERET